MVALVPSIGEMMAGGGSVATAVGALILKHQKLPANRIGNAQRKENSPINHVLVCTNSIAGQNAAIVLKKT